MCIRDRLYMVYTAEGMCQIAVQEYTADYKDGFLTTMVCFYTLVTVRFIFLLGLRVYCLRKSNRKIIIL